MASGRLAQLARAPARHAGGRWFKSNTAQCFALLTDDVNRAFFMPESGVFETLNCKEVCPCFPSAKVAQVKLLG